MTTDIANKYEFQYMPCEPKICGPGDGESSTVCQIQKSNNNAFSLGRYQNFKWTVTNADPKNLAFEVHYGGGDVAQGTARTTIVSFKRGAVGKTNFSYHDEDQSKLIYYFNVTGSGVAPNSSGGGIAAGPIGLVIIFLALGAFIAYCVIGGIFMYSQKGARGTEVIPNYTFWKDFPFLIKDGFLFVISPCYKRSDKYQGL
jgi:hypothetical protein